MGGVAHGPGKVGALDLAEATARGWPTVAVPADSQYILRQPLGQLLYRLLPVHGTNIFLGCMHCACSHRGARWLTSSRFIIFREWWLDVADDSRLPGPGQDHWHWHWPCRPPRAADHDVLPPPGGTRSTRRDREAGAKAVCQRCPVIDACRRHALQAQEPCGIWGGLSEEERAGLLRAQRRARSVPGGARSSARHDVDAELDPPPGGPVVHRTQPGRG